ncbi:MAG: riboflavin synthase [Candidatus Aminicenantes bacterium]|nr:riboflavin synthase [Candidatus Aminicenantes bacterium]
MFTGIIARTGVFKGFRQGRREMAVDAGELAGRVAAGDSVAVHGACLTVVSKDGTVLAFDVSQETLAKTTLGGLRPGDAVNLELPVTAEGFLGGHIVTGHVDGTARVLRAVARRPGRRLEIALPAALRPFVVAKGSVAVDGASLTVAGLKLASFEVELIPLTLERTALGRLRPGDAVNLECDILGKYVYNYFSRKPR